ncbi:MAG: hypothetical protein U5L07_04760 [Desulfobacterales bacterium]|nr:hypothetical protein [Desulfobacterales bacterium]
MRIDVNEPAVKRLIQNKAGIAILVGLILGCLMLAMYGLIEFNLIERVTTLINKNTPAHVFLGLMLVLPLVGVPLSVFIFVLGIKFGIGYGILILMLIMPVHILTSFIIARTVRQPIRNFLVNRKNYHIPEIPENKLALFSFLFLAVPVLPYAAKNYVLPLAGVPFRYCMWLNWAIQGTLSIPVLILGKSAADMNLLLFGITLAVLVLLFLGLRWLRNWYETL